MPDKPRILILGGTHEAVRLAETLAPLAEITSSLAGRAGIPTLPGRVRVGGFGGAPGLRAYLEAERFDAVLDATHPFAARISAHAVEACHILGLPRLRLERPSWIQTSDDRWIMVADMAEARRRLPELGRRAFLTVGASEVSAFSGVTDVWFLVRLLKPGNVPLAAYTVITGRPPFPTEAEAVLMRDHRVDVLVTKESGGDATYGKIQAARDLEIPVLMVRRPPSPPGARAETVAEAVGWIMARKG